MQIIQTRFSLCICFFFICLLSSCFRTFYFTGNENLNPSNLASVKEGRSTKYELMSILGEPDQIVVGHDKSSITNLLNILSSPKINNIQDGEYEVWNYYVRNRLIINFNEERYSETICYFIINEDSIVIRKLCNDKIVKNYSDFDSGPGYVTTTDAQEDNHAVPVGEKIIMQFFIKFGVNRSTISSIHLEQLRQMAELMKSYPDTTAVIEGHTDSRGSAARNLRLSRIRARSVKKYFTHTFGISPDRITAKGFGETRPIASNSTVEGRRKNRRVMVTLYDNAENL